MLSLTFNRGIPLFFATSRQSSVEHAKTSEATGTPFPRKLHLQIDDCSREAKTRQVTIVFEGLFSTHSALLVVT